MRYSFESAQHVEGICIEYSRLKWSSMLKQLDTYLFRITISTFVQPHFL